MKQIIAILMAVAAASCQAVTQTNANTNVQANAPAFNQTNAAAANVNYAQRAVKVDDAFMYELLAIKEIVDDAQQKGLLTQLLTLDFLWNSSNSAQNMFQSVNFNATNAGLYYDQSAQAFKMVDINTGANLTINDLVARLQAQSKTAAPVQSGILDASLDLNLLNLLKINTGVGVLSGLVDAGLGLNLANLVNLGVDASVLSGLVDAGLGLNLANLVNVGANASVLSGLADAGVGVNVGKIANAGANIHVPDIRLPPVRVKAGADANARVMSGLLLPLANLGLDLNALDLVKLGVGANVGLN